MASHEADLIISRFMPLGLEHNGKNLDKKHENEKYNQRLIIFSLSQNAKYFSKF